MYCERKILPKNFHPDYKAAYLQDRKTILGRYHKKISCITKNLSGVEAELRVNEDYGPVIEISGISKDMEKALRKLLGDFAIPPETQIGLPKEYGGPGTESGFEIAKNIIEEQGHTIGIPGKDFEIAEGYVPIDLKGKSSKKSKT